MPAKPLTAEQLEDAERLNGLFADWQRQRKEKGESFSQEFAAETLNFGQSALSQYLKGKIPLNIEALRKFAALIGCEREAISPSLAAKIRELAEEPQHTGNESEASINSHNVVVLDSSGTAAPTTIDPAALTAQQRLKAALVPLGVSADTLAGVTKVGVDVASQWLAGEGQELTLIHAVAIQNTYQVNAVWLTKGKGEPGVAVMYNDEYRPIPLTKHWQLIPVVGMAQLGDNGHWVEVEYGNGHVDHPSRDRDAYALRCVGDSMSPKIEAGDFVIVEPNTVPKPGKNVLLKSKDGRVMVKKFLYKAAGRTYLVSVNAAHPPVSFGDEEIDKMHYVRAIVDGDAWIPE